MTITVAVPQVQVQAQFSPGTLTDISAFVQNFTITRPVTRLQGPLWQYQAGTLQATLDNSDGRFDPDNLAGPYTSSTGLQQVVTTFGPGHSGTWIAPRNLSGTTIQVEAWGPGDAGTAGVVATSGGLGGGGGEYAAENTYTVIPGNSYAYVSPASAGSSTTFDGTGVVAHSASGATAGSGSSNSIHFNGGTGGAAGTATPTAVGGGGGSSGGHAGAGSNGAAGNSGGAGGAAPADGYAGGAGAANSLYPGQSGQGPGGGGGGGALGGSAAFFGRYATSNGGNGRGGQVRLTYFVTITPSATVSQVLPMVPVQVTATWPVAPFPAQVLNPATFQTLITVPVTSGTFTVNWSVTLGGTTGVNDVNNFQLALQNAGLPFGGFLVGSVNTSSVGNTVQASFQLTIPSGGGPLVLQVKGSTPTTGATYGGTLSVTYSLFSGFADSWQESPVDYEGGYSEFVLSATDGFGVLSSNTLAALGSGLGAGEDSGARVNRILDIAGWPPSARQVDTGDSAQQATPLGASALSLLQLTGDTEIGEVYCNGSGNVVFRHRRAIISDTRSNTPQAVFGDLPGAAQAAGTELAYAMVGRANDNTTIANDIQITAAGSSNLQEAQDPVSEYIYQGARSYVRTDLMLSSDAEAFQYANWVLFISKNAENRFDTLTVDPLADVANLYPQVLGREIGDRIEVWKRTSGATGIAPPSVNSTFEGSVGTWAVLNNTSAPFDSGAFAHSGANSMSLSSLAAGDMQASHTLYANTLAQGMRVTAGQQVTASAWFLAAATSRACQMGVAFFNSSGTHLSDIYGGPVTDGTGGWVQATDSGSIIAPAGAVRAIAIPVVKATGGVAEVHFVDDVTMVAGPAISKDVFIRGIAHTFDATSEAWQTVWTLQSAARYGNFLTLDSATLGLLDVDALGY